MGKKGWLGGGSCYRLFYLTQILIYQYYETTIFLNRLNKNVLGTATVIFSGAAAKLLDTKK